MGIFWGDEPMDNRGWEDLSAEERVHLEVQYLYNIKGRDILDYLDLGEESLDHLAICLENVLHTTGKDGSEQPSLARLGACVLAMFRKQSLDAVREAYLNRDIDL